MCLDMSSMNILVEENNSRLSNSMQKLNIIDLQLLNSEVSKTTIE